VFVCTSNFNGFISSANLGGLGNFVIKLLCDAEGSDCPMTSFLEER
jgi:hypothetical protein